MLFVEFRFFIFFAIVFSVAWMLRANTARKLWLLVCSHFFYACFFIGPPLDFFHAISTRHWQYLPEGWWFPLVLMASTCMDYAVGRALGGSESAGRRRGWLMLSLAVNLGVLCYFKYCNFFILSAGSFLRWTGLPVSVHTLRIILPYGISFYTFQSMSYTIEVYRRHIEPERSFLDLAFFIGFFPQLVAGPIVRSMSFLPQTKQTPRWAQVDVRGSLVLFLTGYVKKACLAETAAPYVDHYFSAPAAHTVLSAWIAVLLYAVQIYCDFSGYTDMAIATARLLGYELTMNFNFPYFSRNVAEFWRRWHISLSTWLRDYLYISLGGNRGSRWFTCRNLLLTMLLGGLWHGAAWGFVVWGALHGLGLVIHREWVRWKGRPAHSAPWRDALAMLATFYFVCICWAWFRAPDLSTALTVSKALILFRSAGQEVLNPTLLVFFAALGIVHALNARQVFKTWWRKLNDWIFAAGYGAAIAVVLLFVPQHYSAFIYFRF